MALIWKIFYRMISLKLISIVPCIRGDYWYLVYKGVTGAPESFYDLYMGSDTSYQTKLKAQSTSGATEKKHFKSDLINLWSLLDINQVRIAIIKNNSERAFFLFNGTGTSRTSWFSQERLLDTSYTDLNVTTTTNYFSIDGHGGTIHRRFYINSNYGGCNNDAGWLLVVDINSSMTCSYERINLPVIMYSPMAKKTTYVIDSDIADSMEIYVNFINKATTVASAKEQTTTTETSSSVTPAVTNQKETIQIDKLTDAMKMNRKDTNKYLRTLISPYESRISAVTMGILGITIISCLCGFIIFLDCITFGQNICEKKKMNKKNIHQQ